MEALAALGVAKRAQTRAGALSHGEKRLLEIAIALAQAPKLLLLDEPMAGAGAEETRRLVETLKRLKRRYTIVLVEHDMHAVFALADRKSTRLNSSHANISYAVFCLKKQKHIR